MYKPKPTDAKQLESGNKVILLTGTFNPAHMDYFRAIESLVVLPEVDQVWISPFVSNKDSTHIRNMTTILASESTSATRKQVACCSVGLDKEYTSPEDIRTWCLSNYPGINFQIARIDGLHQQEDIAITFSNNKVEKEASETIFVKYLPQPVDLICRIKDGQDMSRSFCCSVWDYIQNNKIYRI